MNRTRLLIVFGAAALSAALLTWFLYANTVKPQKEQRTTVQAAVHDLSIGQVVKATDLKPVTVLAKDMPKGAVLIAKDAVDRVVIYPVSANQPVVSAQLSTATGAEGVPATIEAGYRAVSVQITDVSGVAGFVQPGAHVDVMFTRPGSMTEAITSTILQNVRVLAVGHSVQAGQAVDPKAPKVPVATLLVTPPDAQKLELAKNQGRISLSLRNPLDTSTPVNGDPVSTDILDPTLGARLARDRKIRAAGGIPGDMNADPDRPVAKKKEPPPPPPPPKAVVDVFRGDKHVQEVFAQ